MKNQKSSDLTLINVDFSKLNQEIPYTHQGISCGFPSPAEDLGEDTIDLNQLLIKNPATTFFAKVQGDSMKDAGINEGDMVIVDRSLTPSHHKIAVCFIDGEFTIKRVDFKKGKLLLIAENKEYDPIIITEDNDFIIWGIVTNVIKKL